MKADVIFLKKTERIDYMKKKGMFFLCCTSLILVSTAMDAHAFTDKRTTEVKKPHLGTAPKLHYHEMVGGIQRHVKPHKIRKE